MINTSTTVCGGLKKSTRYTSASKFIDYYAPKPHNHKNKGHHSLSCEDHAPDNFEIRPPEAVSFK